MLNLQGIYIQYGERILLDRVSVSILDKDKIGLVGRNGAGKSTLLKIISGELLPQDGKVSQPAESRIGYLHQDMFMPKGKTVMEETLTAFEEIKIIEDKIHHLNEQVSTRTDYESDEYHDLLVHLVDLTERHSYMGGVDMVAESEKVLKGLGFTQTDFTKRTETLSGGWQMRVELAKMLLKQPDYLLLDEPTNHLDIESIIWLEEFLKDYPGTVIVISHDKEFLNNITQRTLEVELGKLYDYKAPYYKYVEMRKERRELTQNAFDNQQRMLAQKERTITRFMAKASKTKMAQSMQKQLNKIERIEIEDEDVDVMNLRFPPAPRSGQIVISCDHLSKSYGSKSVLNDIHFKIDRGERVSFVGQNGQGKTTLAKILVGAEAASSGEINPGHNTMIGYYAQNQAEVLDPKITLLQTLERDCPPEMRTKLRAILGAFLFSGEDVDKKVSVLSGGERARLALAAMLLRPFNLLVLDEPTNHLDMMSKEVLKKALMEYDGTLLVVSHDREFLAGLTHRTVEFKDGKLKEYLGDINYFLEERNMMHIRELEQQVKTNAVKKENNSNSVRQDEDTKKLRKKSVQLEKDIEKIEGSIKEIETQMAAPTFHEKPDASKIYDQYNQLKKKLDETMAEWETVVSELEK